VESVSSCQAIPVPKSMSRHDRLCTVKRQRAIPRTGLLMAPDVQSRTVPALSAGHILTLGYLKIVITTGLSGRVRQGGVISAVAVGHRQAALAVMCRG